MAAEAAVGFVVEAFGNLLVEEAKFLAEVSDQVEDLQLELDRLRSFLRDAEARQNDQRDIQVWISQSRDLAYEAEDLLEEYAFRVASQRENILKRTVCILKECYVRRSIGSKIQRLKSKISGLTGSFQRRGMKSFAMEREGSSSSSLQELRRTYSHVVEDDFIKLDNDVEMLAGHLVNENEADLHGVVSISGMGGLGKTTLARKVYNHPKVQGCFENLAWVCISQQWQKREVLRGILSEFFREQGQEIKEWRDEKMTRELFQTMQNKKCLVVLDDIWTTDAWESIKQAFPVAKSGSKLLLTTRNRSVALHIGPNGFHHEPRLLSDMESWELLQIKALRERTSTGLEEMQEMKELGKEMVKHCGGLPLAVVVLGGILSTKRGIKEWKSVHKNVKAHIGRGKNIVQEQGEVEKILALSYNDLPPKLKSCFLYLGRFPEDSDIDVEKLYQLWIAEGMISTKDQISEEESMMDVAERYLGELVERSMVQVKVDDDNMLGMSSFQYCRLHDLIRELSLKKAEEENFFSFVHSQNGFDDPVYKSSSSTHQIHRLVIHFREEDLLKYVPPQKRITRHLRSLRVLLVEGYGPERTMKFHFSWFRMLRVLEIKCSSRNYWKLFFRGKSCFEEFCFEEFGFKELGFCVVDYLDLSESLGNLIHLRYLSLGECVFFCLPSSLGNLKHLQTLDLRDAENLGMPNVIWKMRQLKYLYLPDGGWAPFTCLKLRLDGLNKLEIVEGFDSSYCFCKDLVKLTNLRSLDARFYVEDCDLQEIVMFILETKSLLKVRLDLTFEYISQVGYTSSWSAIVAKLFSCGKLTRLVMRNPIGNLPRYEPGFALIYLRLTDSRIESDPMETLEMIPNLKFLTLNWDSFLGTEMQCRAAGFPQLRELRFRGLPKLKKWIIAEGAMPNLSILQIWHCRELEMIPDGLRFITSLKKLEVRSMPEEFNRRLQVIDGQEGEDFYKISHVTLVKVWADEDFSNASLMRNCMVQDFSNI